jgi:hypothetical protein
VDEVPGVYEMYAVERPRVADSGRRLFTRAAFDALRRETDVLTDRDRRRDARGLRGLAVGPPDYLATPAAETIGQIVLVLDPVAYGVSLLLIVAAC